MIVCLEDPNAGVRLDLLNETIESQEFWGQLHTLEKLFTVVRKLIAWVEECPCHGGREAPTPQLQTRWQACPLRALRLPELVTGALYDKLHHICCIEAAELFTDLTGVDSKIQAKCVQECFPCFTCIT